MIIKGNENPYLRGNPAKRYLKTAFSEMENPFSGMNDFERSEAIKRFAEHHSENFARSMARIKALCRQYNFFQLLAHFAFYDQLILDGEENNASYSPVEQSATELLQAIILQIPEDELQLRLGDRPPPEVLREMNSLLGGITNSFSFKRFASSGAPNKSATLLSELMRTHTAAVRNEGFPSQVRRTMTDIVTPLDREFESRRAIKLTDLAALLWNLVQVVEARINKDLEARQLVLGRKRPTDIVDAFLRHHGFDDKKSLDFRTQIQATNFTVVDLRSHLMHVWDHGTFGLFKLSWGDLLAACPSGIETRVIEPFVSLWTIGLGDLAGDDPEHFFLDNPVWMRPIVRFGPDHFLLPIPTLIQSFGRQLLERALQSEPDLWEKYLSKVRPKYVEQFVCNEFVRTMPTARVISGVRWMDPKDSRLYETDLLIIHDAHVLIIECKAGRITARARRGDIARLEKEIGKLIAEPSVQSERFASLLLSSKDTLQLEASDGSLHSIETDKILRIVRINVTLDYFGPVGLLARMMRERALVPLDSKPVATLSMHELESVIDVLDRPALLFHYLDRRPEIETSNDLLGNELSLLSLYLATGFDLGELEGGDSKAMALPAMERDLDPYFMGKEFRQPTIKPRRRFTGWWNDMLATADKRGNFGWMETSYALLCVGHERQKAFERGVKKMLKEVKSKWRDPGHRNVCYLFAASPARRIALMCVGVKNVTLEQQRATVQRAFNAVTQTQSSASSVAIVMSASTKTYPYSALYFIRPQAEDRSI